ncbi:MAG: RraA family protein [Burkholderiaceae bacterium]
MIDEAPKFTVQEPAAPRPDPALIKPFKGIQTGFIVDALGGGGGLAHTIKPMFADQSEMCGVVLTCDAGPADNLALLAALEHVQQGDIIVASAHGHLDCAIAGDLVLGMAKNGGAQGFVTDGCVRDTRGIRSVGLPCFAAGVTPNSPHKSGPGIVGAPIVLAGVHIASGDVIVSDEDGVVVIPQARLAEVAQRLEQVLAAEKTLDAKVQAGLTRLPLDN